MPESNKNPALPGGFVAFRPGLILPSAIEHMASVSRSLRDRYADTSAAHSEAWDRLATALEEHARDVAELGRLVDNTQQTTEKW